MPERMHVNFGGDPGRDDYGLPPVDIEIPDDARELDRDVHAYYREMRAHRRRMLARRIYTPLSRDGMVLPLLAGCLALTLLAGTLLTVLTTGQSTITPPRQPGTARSHNAPAAGAPGGLLPNAEVLVNGQMATLQGLPPGVLVLALVPAGCQCTPDLAVLAAHVMQAHADMYLIGTQPAQLIALSRRVGLGTAHAVTDVYHQLPARYRPAALTAVLVRPDGRIASFFLNPAHNPKFEVAMRSMERPATPAPSGTATTSLAPSGTRTRALPRRATPVLAALTSATG